MQWKKLFRDFYNSERIGGLLLLSCTVSSLLIANGPFGEGYIHFWHQQIDLSFAGLNLNFSMSHWINDGLMTVFFLLVGLEIEHELYAGELSRFSTAVLPFVAAIGGMLVPALIHFSFNGGTPTQNGFGIPMATDIAFTLGMLSLAGKRVSYALKIFVAALAIIDDLGSILLIGLFYGSAIHWVYTGLSVGILGLLFLLNRLKVQALVFYLLPGIALWYCMMQSGIHPAIAGVLLAFSIPYSGNRESTPSYRLQQFLHKPVNFFIVPLFALANTGILLNEGWFAAMGSRNNLGIMVGLVVGKPVGILLFCLLATALFKASLPARTNWVKMVGASILGGIGFTMSIFISNLAFADAEVVSYSKVAVLLGSLVATVIGLGVLLNGKP